ncbi:hypothetical protein UFOVP1_58 [uncultured Caudovirales phage]|uniref:Uncharacterized protein n=1 Tax=uncultured Caudovirales phage TaxID=2100421 RepID=A0A6J5KJD6_9CAUD|nr:hypothetical protein UFOVP1_58 [uncultured Caudovirales phage]
MIRGHNNKNSIVVDEDDRAFSRPDRQIEPDREFNRTPERVPYAKQQVLSFGEREGYTRRLVNEAPGEIDKMIRAGWNVVTNITANTADDYGQVNQLDSVVRILVNKDPRAPVRTAVLMEIPIEWYEADMKEQQRLLDEQEEQFNPNKYKQRGFDYGEMSIKRHKNPHKQ